MEDKFVGIGKIHFDKSEDGRNIPNLHFVVIENDDDRYVGVSLEFGIVANGESAKGAATRLVGIVYDHVMHVRAKTDGYAELIESARMGTPPEYWAEFRRIEFTLAEQGRDLSHSAGEQVHPEDIPLVIGDPTIEHAGEPPSRSKRILTPARVEYEDLAAA